MTQQQGMKISEEAERAIASGLIAHVEPDGTLRRTLTTKEWLAEIVANDEKKAQ